jgi:selenocysteine lyase/cysteine desulfurase
MDRRNFLGRSALALGAAAILPSKTTSSATAIAGNSWTEFRALFNLNPGLIHMTQMLLASHPKPVRDAIELHRKHLDENPTEYWENNFIQFEQRVIASAAKYLQVDPQEVVLTDSTTMGLSILYSGLKLKPNDEILTTTHDHYSTEKSIEYACLKTGAKVKRISLYSDPATVTADQIVNTLIKNISPATRVMAITWVHSVSGVKLPVTSISQALKEVNAKRDASARIYLCVDGVHGFGIDDITMATMGCDFFVAGTHKWIFGPRGTGILFARKDAWDMVNPIIPAFSELSYGMWMGAIPEGKIHFSDLVTPGGFHSFEHRWSLHEAFELLLKTGKGEIMNRTQTLNGKLKDALRQIQHVKLVTPVDKSLSAGINCFEVAGMKHEDVMHKLRQKKIISSITPYKIKLNRLTPSALNTEDEVAECIRALENIKSS